MRRRAAVPWRTWLPILPLLVACISVFDAWLAPRNIASWLLLLSFCS